MERPPAPRPEADASDGALVRRLSGGDTTALEALYDRYARPRSRCPAGSPATRSSRRRSCRRSSWRSGRTRRSTIHCAAASRAGCSPRPTTRRSTRSGASRPYGPGGRAWPRRPTTTRPRRSADLPPVEDAAWAGLRGERVRRALSALPTPQREALVLAYYAGYTQSEIAARTGTPLGTVKTRMLAGMRKLRQLLDEVADSPGRGPAMSTPQGPRFDRPPSRAPGWMCRGPTGRVRMGRVRAGRVRMGRVRAGRVRMGRVRAGRVRMGRVRMGRVRAGRSPRTDTVAGCARRGLGAVRARPGGRGALRRAPPRMRTLHGDRARVALHGRRPGVRAAGRGAAAGAEVAARWRRSRPIGAVPGGRDRRWRRSRRAGRTAAAPGTPGYHDWFAAGPSRPEHGADRRPVTDRRRSRESPTASPTAARQRALDSGPDSRARQQTRPPVRQQVGHVVAGEPDDAPGRPDRRSTVSADGDVPGNVVSLEPRRRHRSSGSVPPPPPRSH